MTTTTIASPTAHVIRSRPRRCSPRALPGRVGAKPFVPVVWPDGHHDQIIITEAVTEKRLAEIRGCVIDKPTFVLNGTGRIGVTCSTWNPALNALIDENTIVDGAGVLHLIGREFQWVRDGVHRQTSVPLIATISLDGTVSFEAPDNTWYLTRRVFGAAERRDLLKDIGSMDRPGLPGWFETGGCVKTRDTALKTRGVSSAALTGTGSISAFFTHPAADVIGPVHLTAEIYLPIGTEVGTEVMAITTRPTATSKIYDRFVFTVQDDTKIGGWTRIDIHAQSPTKTPFYVSVELFSEGTHGATHFDDVRSLKNDTTGWPTPIDLTQQMLLALHHAQGADKSTFGFNVRKGWPTETTEAFGIRHIEHTQFTDWLATIVEREDGADWWPEFRGRELWFSKRRGVDHRTYELHQRLVGGTGWTHDESTYTTSQIVVGDGEGPTRPEGGVLLPRPPAGLVLDDVYRPANGTPLSALDPLARQLLARNSQPQTQMGPLTVPADLLEVINPGDRLNTGARTGLLRTPTDWAYRVAQVAVNIETDQLELT